jgi:hypothetical protein
LIATRVCHVIKTTSSKCLFGVLKRAHAAQRSRQRTERIAPLCAYHYDFSGIALISDELDALRYAVGSNINVKPVQLGAGLLGQIP